MYAVQFFILQNENNHPIKNNIFYYFYTLSKKYNKNI